MREGLHTSLTSLFVFTALAVCAGCGDTRVNQSAVDEQTEQAPDNATITPFPVESPVAEKPAGTDATGTPATSGDGASDSPDAKDGSIVRLMVGLDVVRVDVPVGTLSESAPQPDPPSSQPTTSRADPPPATRPVNVAADIWKHLDERWVSPEQAVTLRNNGLRVGVGRTDRWPAIKAALDGIPDHLVYHESTVLGAGVLGLEITREPQDQTLFYFRPDGSLAGETIPGCLNVLQVLYEISANDPSRVTLRIVPEFRQGLRGREWTKVNGRYTRIPVYNGKAIYELAMQATLPAKTFMVIGPGEGISLSSVIGRVLLTHRVEQKQYESIYFLTPQVFRSRPKTSE